MAMTSRERVEATIQFQEPDRVPFNFWMDRRRMAELLENYERRCALHRIDYALCTTDTPLEERLVDLLSRRARATMGAAGGAPGGAGAGTGGGIGGGTS